MQAEELVKECPSCGYINLENNTECDECDRDIVTVQAIKRSEVPEVEELEDEINEPLSESCNHENLSGNYCLDCRSFVEINETKAGEWILTFPWMEYTVLNHLWIGRIKPAPKEIADALEANFKNVSRNHAQLSVEEGKLYVVDLESTNGTFVDSKRIGIHEKTELIQGSILRLAKDLEITISFKEI